MTLRYIHFMMGTLRRTRGFFEPKETMQQLAAGYHPTAVETKKIKKRQVYWCFRW